MEPVKVLIKRVSDGSAISYGEFKPCKEKRIYIGGGALVEYFFDRVENRFYISKESFKRCNEQTLSINGMHFHEKDAVDFETLEKMRRDLNGY